MNMYKCKFTFISKIRKNLWIQSLATCSTVAKSNIENNLQFSKHKVKILQLVNKSKLEKLTQFMSASDAATLISKRTSDGPYKSLDDVLLKTKIDVDSWNNLCTSVINYRKEQKWKNCIKPNIKTTAMPSTILGISVGSTAITWTLIDCNFNVLVWDSTIWQSKSLKYDVINLVPGLVKKLPLSSSYVMEEFNINNKCLNRALFMSQYTISDSIGSCIKLMINQRTNNSNSVADTLYVLKSSTTARFFNLMIASEAIAVDYIMKKILEDTKTDDKLLRDIHIAHELKQKYMGKNAAEREQMGWSLLTTLACLHIIRL